MNQQRCKWSIDPWCVCFERLFE